MIESKHGTSVPGYEPGSLPPRPTTYNHVILPALVVISLIGLATAGIGIAGYLPSYATYAGAGVGLSAFIAASVLGCVHCYGEEKRPKPTLEKVVNPTPVSNGKPLSVPKEGRDVVQRPQEPKAKPRPEQSKPPIQQKPPEKKKPPSLKQVLEGVPALNFVEKQASSIPLISTENGTTSFESIGKDARNIIFGGLTRRDLLQFGLACKSFLDLSDEYIRQNLRHGVWRRLFIDNKFVSFCTGSPSRYEVGASKVFSIFPDGYLLAYNDKLDLSTLEGHRYIKLQNIPKEMLLSPYDHFWSDGKRILACSAKSNLSNGSALISYYEKGIQKTGENRYNLIFQNKLQDGENVLGISIHNNDVVICFSDRYNNLLFQEKSFSKLCEIRCDNAIKIFKANEGLGSDLFAVSKIGKCGEDFYLNIHRGLDDNFVLIYNKDKKSLQKIQCTCVEETRLEDSVDSSGRYLFIGNKIYRRDEDNYVLIQSISSSGGLKFFCQKAYKNFLLRLYEKNVLEVWILDSSGGYALKATHKINVPNSKHFGSFLLADQKVLLVDSHIKGCSTVHSDTYLLDFSSQFDTEPSVSL